jgi:hypothetical protein
LLVGDGLQSRTTISFTHVVASDVPERVGNGITANRPRFRARRGRADRCVNTLVRRENSGCGAAKVPERRGIVRLGQGQSGLRSSAGVHSVSGQTDSETLLDNVASNGLVHLYYEAEVLPAATRANAIGRVRFLPDRRTVVEFRILMPSGA